MSELFDAVDALVARSRSRQDLPEPAERERLRKAARLTQEEVADGLGIRRETMARWEAGQVEPRQPKRRAYALLLARLTEDHGTQGLTDWLTRARATGSTPTAKGEQA